MLILKETAWSDLIISRVTGNRIVVCAVPYIKDGEVQGAIGATISSNW
jgi:hypothetical protein